MVVYTMLYTNGIWLYAPRYIPCYITLVHCYVTCYLTLFTGSHCYVTSYLTLQYKRLNHTFWPARALSACLPTPRDLDAPLLLSSVCSPPDKATASSSSPSATFSPSAPRYLLGVVVAACSGRGQRKHQAP